jgi:hypothetical protein
MSIPVGSYVALTAQGGSEYLGQVFTKEVSVQQGAEIGLELDPSLSALFPEGMSFSSSHTYPLSGATPTALASSHPRAKAW